MYALRCFFHTASFSAGVVVAVKVAFSGYPRALPAEHKRLAAVWAVDFQPIELGVPDLCESSEAAGAKSGYEGYGLHGGSLLVLIV